MKTCASLLKLVEREREGELVDRALIKNILGIFIEVSKWSGQWQCFRVTLGSIRALSKLKHVCSCRACGVPCGRRP